MTRSLSKWQLLLLVTGVWIVADQATKFLAVEHLTLAFRPRDDMGQQVRAFASKDHPIAVRTVEVTSWWEHRYKENPGAAFSFLAGASEKVRVPFFHLISIAAIAFILGYYRKLSDSQRYLQVALALVLGGAIGNAIDRILHGYVIDFIDWHAGSAYWPTFNVADSGITVGLAMLLLERVFIKKPASHPEPKKA
jgi:signal peptidase II